MLIFINKFWKFASLIPNISRVWLRDGHTWLANNCLLHGEFDPVFSNQLQNNWTCNGKNLVFYLCNKNKVLTLKCDLYICGVSPLQCIRKVNGVPHLLFLSVPKGRERASHTPCTLRTLQWGHFHPFVGDARKQTWGCSHKNGGRLL